MPCVRRTPCRQGQRLQGEAKVEEAPAASPGDAPGSAVEQPEIAEAPRAPKQAKLVRVGRWGSSMVLAKKEVGKSGAPGKATQEMSWFEVNKEPNRRMVREAENEACIGGQRNPRRALRHIPGARAVALAVRVAFELFRTRHVEQVDALAASFGCPDLSEPDKGLVDEYRRDLRRVLGAPLELRKPLR